MEFAQKVKFNFKSQIILKVEIQLQFVILIFKKSIYKIWPINSYFTKATSYFEFYK